MKTKKAADFSELLRPKSVNACFVLGVVLVVDVIPVYVPDLASDVICHNLDLPSLMTKPGCNFDLSLRCKLMTELLGRSVPSARLCCLPEISHLQPRCRRARRRGSVALGLVF